MKRKSVLLSVCLLIALGITKIAHDAKLDPRVDGIESPPAISKPLRLSPRAEMSPPPKPIPGITMYDQIEDAPAWSIRYGKEFWKRPQTEPTASITSTQANFDIGDVIARVSHAVRRNDASGLPTLNANTYTAVFTERGFTITPHVYVGDQPLPASNGNEAKHGRSRPATVSVYEPDIFATSEFETTLVRAGGEILYTASAADIPSSFIGNTGQRLLNQDKGLIEHFEADANGVEVTWVLNEQPATGEALDLTFRLTGLSVLRTEEEGAYVLGDSIGNPKVRVSEVTLVDATGTKMNVPLQYNDGQFNVHVAEPMLAQLTFPIAIDPTVGPALELGIAGAAGLQHEPSVAWNGNVNEPRYLVVWQDARNYSSETKEAIYGTRVAANGRVVDTSGIRISNSSLTGSSYLPRVASNGDDWLVVWEYGASGSNTDIYGARVATGGIVGSSFVICNQGNIQRAPHVASVGSDYFVVWMDTRHGTEFTEDVFGARVPAGTTAFPANGAGICLSEWRSNTGAVVDRNRARIAGNGTDYLVVWDGIKPPAIFNGVYAAKISNSGTTGWSITTGAPGCSALVAEDTLTGLAGNPSVAGQNGAWFIAWGESTIHGALATVDGSANLVINSEVTFPCVNCSAELKPVVAANGSIYMVVWPTGIAAHHFLGSRVSSAGAILDPEGFVVAATTGVQTNLIDHAIAGSTDDFLFVYAGSNVPEPEAADSNHAADIVASRISSGAPPNNIRDRFLVSTASAHPLQINPAVSGDNPCVVVWEHVQGAGTWHIFAARIAPSGWPRDPNGVLIDNNSANEPRPAIAGVGAGKFIVWERSGNLYGKLLEEQNIGGAFVLVPGSEMLIRNVGGGGSTAQLPSIAFNDSGSTLNWMVAWEENPTGSWQIKGSIVNWTGTGNPTVSLPFSLHQPTSNFKRSPSVGSDNSRYLVAWEDINSIDIHGQMFTTSGALFGSQFTIASSAVNSLKVPSVAGRAGSGFVVAYDVRAGVDTSISAVPVSSSGTVGPASSIANTIGVQYLPVVGNNGSTTFLVTWTDQQATGVDVRAGRVSFVAGGTPTLTVLDPGGFVLNNQPVSTQQYTAVGVLGRTDGSGGPDYVVAYEHHVPSVNPRIRANIVVP